MNVQKFQANSYFVNQGPVMISTVHAHLYSKISFKQLSESKNRFLKIADSVSHYFLAVNITDPSLHRIITETKENILNLEDKFLAIQKMLKFNFESNIGDDNFLLKEIMKQPVNPTFTTNLNNNIKIKNRKKRQIGVGIAAAAAISIGMYNLYDTTSLRSNIENDINDQNNINQNIFYKLTEDNHNINQLENEVIKFQNQTKKLLLRIIRNKNSKDNAIKFTNLLKTLGVKLNFEYNNMLHSLFNILTGRLSIDLFNIKNLEASYINVKNKINQMGYNLVNNHFSEIFNAKFSYEIENETLHLFIHLLIIPKQNEMFIYKYLNLPIFENNLKIKIQGKSNYLITDKNLDHGIELSENEVNSCQFNTNPIQCPLNYVMKTVQTSCLGLLWRKKHEEAMKVCDVFISKNQEPVILKVKQNIFAVSAVYNETFILSCPSKERELINFTKPTLIRLKPNCKLTSESLIISEPITGPIIELNNILKYPEIPKEIIFKQILPHEEEINKLLSPMSNRIEKQISLSTLKRKIFKKIKDDTKLKNTNLKIFILIGLVIILIIFMIMILTHLIAQHRKNYC